VLVVFVTLGAVVTALRWDGIADLGVKGFVVALREPVPVAEDEWGFELWPGNRLVMAAAAANKKTILYFVIGKPAWNRTLP
jgi:hypothetical protein